MISDTFGFILVLLIGSGGQLLDGAMGMGFGVFSASLLLAAGFPPTSVVPIVNMAKIFTGLFSGLAHWREGNVRRHWLVPLIVPGIIGGVLGAYLLASLPQEKFRFWMGVVLVGMGILMLGRSLFPTFFTSLESSSGGKSRVSWLPRVCLCVLGFVAGFLNSMSGAYGPFATSAVMLAGRAKPSRAVGTVNLAEFFVACSVVSTFLFGTGFYSFSWKLVLALTLGGALTAPLGAYACRRLPPRMLQLGVGLALITLNLRVVISRII
jgi:uncharacterized membrane protein YfcA